MSGIFRDRQSVKGAAVIVVGIGVLAALFAGALIASGAVNVAASVPDSPPLAALLHFTFKRSVAARASDQPPPADLAAPGRIRLGAQQYAMVCAKCHSAPGLGQNPIPLSMHPQPQYLPAVLNQFSDRELHWIVQHGVAYSAMPSWVAQRREDEAWSMVAFLRAMQHMSASDYRAMVALPPESGEKIPYGETVATEPAEFGTMPPPLDEYAFRAPAIEFSAFAMDGSPLATCARCHGKDGKGGATEGEAPDLTLQEPRYLKAALIAYATGKRSSGFMQPVAAQLSPQQIDSLSRHFGDGPATAADATAKTPEADAGLVARGAEIASKGIPTRATPACSTCHNEKTDAGSIAVPRLAGQSKTYLRRQLAAFREGGRGATGIYNPMPGEAHLLTDEDIEALAAYYASLPAEKTAAAPVIAETPARDERAKAIIGEICVTCHQADLRGVASGEYPDLTLQTQQYVGQALRAYRDGRRQNSRMNLVGHDVDEADIEALAAYIGHLPPVPGPAEPAAPRSASPARGAVIAEKGIEARGVPACLSCHGESETQRLPLLARLHGQHREYLAKRLDYFAGPMADAVSGFNPMPAIARALSQQERADLAAWFAAQAPQPKSEAP